MGINGIGVSLQAAASLQVDRKPGDRKAGALAADTREAAASDVDTRDTKSGGGPTGAQNRGKGVSDNKAPEAIKAPEIIKSPGIENNKAYFAIDDTKNVVIRIEDEKGNLVRQIPPEEYLKMKDKIKQNVEELFHTVT
jgi:uncharacterized FlaG/YvyC family protein